MQRQFRIMEGDRKAYSEESQNIIRKQTATIEKLQADNKYLTSELSLAEARREELCKSSQNSRMEEVSQQLEMYQRKIKAEQEQLEAVDTEIKEANKAIAEQRSKMGGVNAATQNFAAVNKKMRVLENRLDKALVKFNQSLASNKALRETIDNLRRERVVFDNIYRKLERELAEKKKAMAEIIESSNQAYEVRDEAGAKMIALKEKAEKEQLTFKMELKELDRVLEHDRKLKTFMGVKSQDRSSKDGEDTMNKRSDRTKKSEKQTGEKKDAQMSSETVQSYEEAFEKIREQTGIQDIDKLVENFIDVEDENFSSFNYVNELNNDIDQIQEQINELKLEIDKIRGQGVNMDNQRKKILKDLEERLQSTQSQCDMYDDKYNALSKTVNMLKAGITNIFNRIDCDKTAITDMLGNAGCNETNMMQYLGIIEQRTNEILQMYHIKSSKSTDKDTVVISGGLLGQGPLAPINAVTIQPPSTGDDYDSDEDEYSDDEQRPMTRADLRNKIMRGITKRETMGRKGDSNRKKANKRTTQGARKVYH